LPPSALDRLVEALAAVAGVPVKLERPSDPEHGDYATGIALRLAKELGKPPRTIAEELVAATKALHDVERAEVAGPGFVNIVLEPAWFGQALAEALEPGYGGGSADPAQRIQVEMVSANPTGPVTVASARNGAYGDSVARLLAFAGNQVEREYYYNDTGAQMDRFRESVEARRRGEEPPENGYMGAYVDELAQEPGDPVPRMLESIEATLERFRIHFDTWERQSVVEAEIAEVLAQIETYEADGATWAPTTRFGDDKDRVVIRSDGSYTYYAADLAYARNKLGRGFDRAIYVLGADHHGYVGRLKAAAGLLGEDPERIEALVYQLVHLTKAGEATKMSKRRGDVVFLDELIDEIGVDASRWYLANRGPDQAIEIDIDLAAEKSQKNPVYYVQYAHARVAGILRNAEGAQPDPAPPAELAVEERELVKRLVEFPGIAAEAAERRSPQAIPNYAIRLADDFHRFYHDHKVLGVEEEAFRLALCEATRAVTARCLDLVGVEAPDRM
jgi:arginyl-tRNA synthetase